MQDESQFRKALKSAQGVSPDHGFVILSGAKSLCIAEKRPGAPLRVTLS